jgi:predicted DNA-binding transcriptional regulator YafY
VVITYRGESGNEWEGEVDPWAVVVRFGRWYLLCHSHRTDAVRTYRVDRVSGVEQTARHFEPPEGLDPVAALEEHLGTGWEYPTRVVFDAAPDDVAPWIHPPMGRLEPLGDGGCALVGSTRNPAMYAQEWLANVPLPFHVDGGPELRAAVEALASRLLHAVADDERSSVPLHTGS